jgi:predicted ferric reductase
MVNTANEQNNWRHISSSESGTAGVVLRAVYVFIILLALAIGWSTVRNTDDPVAVKAGLIAGLAGFTIIAAQVLLGSRLKVLDRAFGLDRVVMLHRKMGVVAAVLLLSHPLLLALGHHSLRLFSSNTSWQVNLGKGAMLLLIAGVLLALFFARLGLDYNIWRLIHKAMIAVVILAFAHSLVIGDAFEIGWVKGWWWALMVFACAAFCRQNFVINPFGRKLFILKSVAKETHDTFTLELEAADKRIFEYKPGQFMFLKLQRGGLPGEEHPFTISSAPSEKGRITATVKKSGNFTDKIDTTNPGDKALVQAPFGRFSYAFEKPNDCIFIAGGVGITPIRSMITALCAVEDKRNAVLIYVNKTEQDIIFRRQLDNPPSNFRVVYVLSRPAQSWQGARGHISAEILKNAAGDLLNYADIYLCGPPLMMKSIMADLESLGVDNKRIHYERFTI